ncbi:MAG: response regulator [Candidatus Eremiobacteraeota bacterium]|nr:response regulator [Candidatus Eremiobacteraeota bacterium]
MKKLYCADDDPNILDIYKRTFSKLEGVEARFFDNGLDIYREVQLDKPDVIISDIILPKMEGLTLSMLLKCDEKYKDIKILIASSVMDPDIDEQVRKVGADGFLKKPFRPQEIREKAKVVLGI